MKNSKRIQRIINKLDDLKEALDYYTGGNNVYSQDIKELRELFNELSIEKKEDHVRLAKKLKAYWKSQNYNSED